MKFIELYEVKKLTDYISDGKGDLLYSVMIPKEIENFIIKVLKDFEKTQRIKYNQTKGSGKMKLPIKKKYFDLIKSGHKTIEYRDAHITFVCEETKEKICLEVKDSIITTGIREKYPDVLEDEYTLVFYLGKEVKE